MGIRVSKIYRIILTKNRVIGNDTRSQAMFHKKIGCISVDMGLRFTRMRVEHGRICRPNIRIIHRMKCVEMFWKSVKRDCSKNQRKRGREQRNERERIMVMGMGIRME